MNYLISLRVNIKDNQWISVGESHSVLWDIRDLICASSGLTILNQQQIGSAKSLIPLLEKGILELSQDDHNYSDYEVQYGLGTIKDVLLFYRNLLTDCVEHPYANLYGAITA